MGIVIPEVLNHYNVYNDKAKKLIGISGEIELGELEALTDTLEGAGVLGEIEDAVTGQFASIKIKIPFSVLYEDMFSIIDTTTPPQLTLDRCYLSHTSSGTMYSFQSHPHIPVRPSPLLPSLRESVC